MIYKRAIWFLGLIAVLVAVASQAQSNVVTQAPLRARPSAPKFAKLGDPAPALKIQEWVKGRPVKIQPGTNVYAIVFCTLSRAGAIALTNLNALQKQYQDKGLVVVAVSDDAPVALRNFIQMRGGDVNFTVGADDLARRTTSDYQLTFDQPMLPRAYLVSREGNVLWYGHPLRDDMGEVADEILSGRYNLEQTQKKIIARDQLEQYMYLARQDNPQTELVGRMLLGFRTNDAPALCEMAMQIATDPGIQKRDFVVANLALDRAQQLATTNALDISITRAILLFQSGQTDAGLASAKAALAAAHTDEEKAEVNSCVHVMEVRLARAKTNQTEAVPAPESAPAPAPAKP